MRLLQAPPKTHDVHMRVGFWFIAACAFLGFAVGAVVPVAAYQVGILHMGMASPGVQHIGLKDGLLFGAVATLFGAWNGILLAINRQLWWLGLLCAMLPCGLFGGCAAALTPHPYDHTSNALVFWLIPILITLGCLQLRRTIWSRYQRPLSK